MSSNNENKHFYCIEFVKSFESKLKSSISID